MTNVSDLYDLWLKPWHLPADKAVNVTIQKAEVKELHPRPTQTENKLVLSFVGKNRRLILNDGNANRMADIGGEDWEAWAGLVIQIKRTSFTKDKETIVISPAPANGKNEALSNFWQTVKSMKMTEAAGQKILTQANGNASQAVDILLAMAQEPVVESQE